MKFKRKTKYAEWVERCKSGNEKCAKCGEVRNLTVDHVVPLNFLTQFIVGEDSKHFLMYNMEENFEILCRYCNQWKQSRIDAKNPKIYMIIRKVLDDAERFYLKQG